MPTRSSSPRSLSLAALTLLALASCSGGGGGGSGGGRTMPGVGPGPGPAVVVSDGTGGARLSPFPDDRLTASDPTRATGRRLVVPGPTGTSLERSFHDEIARLDGFGVMAPITVSFDDAIDLAGVSDGSVVVVNAQPGSARFGERVPLDLGRGSYPTDLGQPNSFYGRDPLSSSGDLVYPPGNPAGHYEASSRTLVLRPLVPLEEGARHVVALTVEVRGASGNAIAPPAGWTRPVQAQDDAALSRALRSSGRDLRWVRYQWAFTTGTPSAELRAIARGLDGAGPLAGALAGAVPTSLGLDDLQTPLADGSPYTLDAGLVTPLLWLVGEMARSAGATDPNARDAGNVLALFDMTAVGYLASGAIRGPELRASARGTFDVDLSRGAVATSATASRITYLLVVPKPCAENNFARPPYPVLLFGHGAGRARIDALAIAGLAARRGWAVACPDAVDHGPDTGLFNLPETVEDLARQNASVDSLVRGAISFLAPLLRASVNTTDPLAKQLRALLLDGILHPLFTDGRATDVNGDGRPDSGETFFTTDAFASRDALRQTVVDDMVLLRALRGLGVDRDGSGRLDADEGDLDGDGALDLGGPTARFAYVGISQGGIVGSILTGADPLVARADLMVPGGCLADLVVTTRLDEVSRRVIGRAFAPVVLGSPDGAGGAFVDVDRGGRKGRVAVAAGGRVRLENTRTGASVEGAVAPDGGFRLHVAADRGDALVVTSLDAQGATAGTLSFASPVDGLGLERSTPAFREWRGLQALALEPADPASYAPFWRSPRGGGAPAGVLVQCSLGDDTVPVFTGAALGRAAGLVSLARNDMLVREGVLLGGTASNVDRTRGVESRAGSGIRFVGVNSHAGILVPDPPSSLSQRARYAAATQRQALGFLASGAIDDSDPIFDVVLPR